ncbi:L-threonylcarbamoyladenylate synthase [Oceanobacillus bengalensis]|uniref:Threonylcarbamoyl-AMP synthase n=1 Tax=Oceanobacillus bengalensis TaxID=1435466 RepID=A0A494YYX9_9BACI|nr:L-threonylcarbamoyladenylate synthase [Oceanobacillus bengalensis]RKQ15372.1 threonylcarbamoyl-AMP synthase [Oceanobacillus bengalensis]
MTETKRWNVNDDIDYKAIIEAAQFLRDGMTVAFPTETVYGLGADATKNSAVAKIFKAKGRPGDNPLIAHVATKEQLFKLVENVPAYVENLIDTFSPGPITYVLQSNGICADNVTAGLSTIGVRIPSHPVARALLKQCNIPIAAPSANISGKPSPTTAEHVWEDLAGKIAGLLDGGPTGVGVESTVIDCTQDIPIILRPGGVTREQLEEVVGKVAFDPALANNKEKPKAPGMKYKHYAPDVPLVLVEGSPREIQETIDKEQQAGKRVAVLVSSKIVGSVNADEILSLGETMNEVATHLYDGLRRFKQGDVDIIICEAFSEEGIGQAVMNRLRKAASHFVSEQ